MDYIKQNIFEVMVVSIFLVIYIIKKLYMLKHKYRLGGARRAKILSRFALMKGLRYDRKNTIIEKESFAEMNFLSGKTPVLEHIIRGTTWKGEAVFSDFFLETQNGKIMSKTIAVFNVNMLNFPKFIIYHSDDWGMISEDTLPAEKFTEKFGENYAVVSPYPQETALFITPELQKFLTEHQGWTVESAKGWLLITKGNIPVPANKYKDYIERIFIVFDAFRELSEKNTQK